MNDLHRLTLKKAITAINKKEITAQELQQAVIDQINKKNKELNVYLDYKKEPAQTTKGPLAGIPIAAKDNFLTTDLVTTASSDVLRGYQPQYESTVTSKLRQAGGFIVGKANLDAWAHGSSTETSAFGATKNPRNPDYMPGGSSGGSAAALAADMTIAAIGSETGGSIRQPAAWCGVVGLKPTYGRVSRYGVVAMASSLDSPGPMTKTVEDAAIMLEHMAGQDKYDGTTSSQPVEKYTDYLGKSIKGLKVGVMYQDLEDLQEYWSLFEPALQALRSLGATVEPVVAMDPKYAIPLYAVIQRGEVSSNLARYDGLRYGQDRSHFGDEAMRRIMVGTYTLAKGYAAKVYKQAQKVRTLFINDYNQLFKKYDVLVAPSSPAYPLRLGESAKHPYFGELMDMLLEPSALAGLPGIGIPIHFDKETNLPLGLNIMGPNFSEGKLLQVAHALEKELAINEWLEGGLS